MYSSKDYKLRESKHALENHFYYTCNGRLIDESHDSKDHCCTPKAHLRVYGGKGGFGSMLRALGARIEKTTNHEACRDLSGRRMRDVNNEKNIAEWLKKKESDEAERKEHHQNKLEKILNPKHSYEDKDYTVSLLMNAEKVDDALNYALKHRSSEVAAGSKRKQENENNSAETKKQKSLWLGFDEELDTDDEDDDNEDDDNSNINISNNKCENITNSTTNKQSCVQQNEKDSIATKSKSDNDSTNKAVEQKPDSNKQTSIAISTNVLNDIEEVTDVEAVTTDIKEVTNDVKEVTTDVKEVTTDVNEVTTDVNELTTDVKEVTTDVKEGNGAKEQASQVSQEMTDNKEQVSKVPAGEKNYLNELSNKDKNETGEIDLSLYSCAEHLEEVGLDQLKSALMFHGLKCGGTLQERAKRLFLLKNTPIEKIDSSLFAKKSKNKK